MKKQPDNVSPIAMSQGLRRYLYFTAACTGAAIMIVEILGAKMLTPYFGASHFVWTAQIAVTLASLAAGYYAGGALVDRSPALHRIYGLILVAAVYLAAMITLLEPLSKRFLAFNLAAGTLVAASVLFFIPLGILAMVGPFFVRVLLLSPGNVGGAVGRLSAISTVGSMIGTMLIGYVLLPLAPNSTTMFCTSLFLAALSLVYFLAWSRGRAPGATALMVATAAVGAVGVRIDHVATYPNSKILARKNSDFGSMHVVEVSGGIRYYMNDFLIQNSYDPATKESVSLFTHMLQLLSQTYSPKLQEVLCIGVGIGIVPMKLVDAGVKVDVVEINPEVIPLAKDYFNFRPSELTVHVADGRQFLNHNRRHYDAVVLDAFLGDSSPSHLLTAEAFGSMRQSLKKEGVLVINCFGSFTPGEDFFLASLDQTLKTQFSDVRIHHSGHGNVFFVASASPLVVHHQPNFAGLPASIQNEARRAWENIGTTDPKNGRVLTDDFNPVEFHDAKNREGFRRSLASAMLRRN